MFKNLWRILIMAVIAIAAFFVVSSLSLSNRLDEGKSFFLLSFLFPPMRTQDGERTKKERGRLILDYAPRNWRYRWILLDGSLALIYLMVFMAVAWLWRPVSLSLFSFIVLFANLFAAHILALLPYHPLPNPSSDSVNHYIANGRPGTMSDSQCRKN
jgi:hypothetical protein